MRPFIFIVYKKRDKLQNELFMTIFLNVNNSKSAVKYFVLLVNLPFHLQACQFVFQQLHLL